MKIQTIFERIVGFLSAVILLWGCSTVRHVPDGEYLLDEVNIAVADNEDVETSELYNFLRQQPNHKVLGFAKLQLATYSLSGRDSSKWYNRWLRRIGQPPVIYDSELTQASARQLRQALVNRGYMDAVVDIDTVARHGKKKMKVSYDIHVGRPHVVSSVGYDITDSLIRDIVLADSAQYNFRPGNLFDRNALDNLRGAISMRLRNAGYYDFNRDYITFMADTVCGSKDIDLTLVLRQPASAHHVRYDVRRVVFVLDDDRHKHVLPDTVVSRFATVVYEGAHYLKPSLLEEKCFIRPGEPFSAGDVEKTYEALGRLSIVKYINIEMRPVADLSRTGLLDAYVFISRNKYQTASVELEGTNSEGDFGFGLGLTYQHRNIARGSQILTAKFRAAYESLSGNVEGLINNRYSEYAGEVGITFPRFELPFLSKSFKKRFLASTEFAVSFNYQERPEYTRIIAGAAWKWKWQQQRPGFTRKHTYDLVDINYVRLPRSTLNFIDEIAPSNPILRYSYEDHFIMRMGYSYYRTNKKTPLLNSSAFVLQPSVTTVRASAEIAGNVLYAISNLIGQKKSDGVYKVLGIQYAQYVKGDFDYTYTRNFNSRNSVSAHVGVGIAYPYGNSSMVPFEKRFYAGGANSVRGWGVRTLGPGAYDSKNSVTDFINQCGDIRLDLSVEYRAKLFWVFEGALFVDAGNIWTIKNYETQPGGEFRLNKFYKQIALAYGLGLRMDFTYFLLRFDLGMKAHNPAMNQEPWPLIHPKWSRDANFHFSVGYPF